MSDIGFRILGHDDLVHFSSRMTDMEARFSFYVKKKTTAGR